MLVMSQGRLGLALVVENNLLVGLFTDGDLRRALSDRGAALNDPVSKYMTLQPKTINADATLAVAEDYMYENKIRCLVVLDDSEKTPVGITEIFDR